MNELAIAILQRAPISEAPVAIWTLVDDKPVAHTDLGADHRLVIAAMETVERVLAARSLHMPSIRATWAVLWDTLDEVDGPSSWRPVELNADPLASLAQARIDWVKRFYGSAAASLPSSNKQKLRLDFAAMRATDLCRGVFAQLPYAGWPLVATAPPMSTRFAVFADHKNDVMVLCVSPAESVDEAGLALAFGLSLCGDRELHLVVPDGSAAATLARLAWMDAPVRVWTYNADDTLDEHSIPTRQEVLAGFQDTLVTHVASLASATGPLAELIDWADRHDELVPGHRPSYAAWHCRGRKVLTIAPTRAGHRVAAGVVSTSAASTLSQGVVAVVTAQDAQAIQPLRDAVERAIHERLDGTDAGHTEHRFQQRLHDSGLKGLQLHQMLREFPAMRPGQRRGYIDFLAVGTKRELRVVEAKVGHDPMIALQALDYLIWAEAHRGDLAAHVGADETLPTQLDLVIMRPEGTSVVDAATAAVLERFDRSISFRVFEAMGDLDGDLHLERVPASRLQTGQRWVHRADRRVSVAAQHRGLVVTRGFFRHPVADLAPGAHKAATALEASGGLHGYVGSVRSSQRFALNLFGSLDAHDATALLRRWFSDVVSGEEPEFEWIDPLDDLQEATASRPHQTQVDVLLRGHRADGRQVAALVEVKFTESGFGGCSHASHASGDDLANCHTRGSFGADTSQCLQLSNRHAGNRRRYAEFLGAAPAPAMVPAGCWWRDLNQPMRLAALAGALIERGEVAECVVALTAPAQNRAVHRQWCQVQELLDFRFEILHPEIVAAHCSAATRTYLTDVYGLVPDETAVAPVPQLPQPTPDLPEVTWSVEHVGDSLNDLVPTTVREATGWALIAELVNRHPGRFVLIEEHPGGGQYDCLSLFTPDAECVLALNRVGNLHVPPGEKSLSNTWARLSLAPIPSMADLVEELWRLPPARPAPMVHGPTMQALATIISSCASDGWQWRNGQGVTTGYGGGPLDSWLDAYPGARAATAERPDGELNYHPHRSWFLVQDMVPNGTMPVAAVDIAGRAWIGDDRYDLTEPDQRATFIAECIHAADPRPASDEPARLPIAQQFGEQAHLAESTPHHHHSQPQGELP